MIPDMPRCLPRLLGLWLCACIGWAAQAQEVDPKKLDPQCADPFKYKTATKTCSLEGVDLSKLTTKELCPEAHLTFTPANGAVASKCEAKAGSSPDPTCESEGVIGLKFSPSKGICVLVVTTKDKQQADLFKDWATGIAVLRPKVATITDASIVDDKVRVNASVKHESSILIARHFYPWNQKRSCLESGQTADNKELPLLSMDRAGGFFRNCTGMMVGVGLPTSGAINGQVVNFVGVGFTIGGGMRDNASLNWHFGVGWGRKFNVRTLGDGFEENKAPPPNEKQVRFKTIDVDAPFTYFTIHW